MDQKQAAEGAQHHIARIAYGENDFGIREEPGNDRKPERVGRKLVYQDLVANVQSKPADECPVGIAIALQFRFASLGKTLQSSSLSQEGAIRFDDGKFLFERDDPGMTAEYLT